MMVRFAENADQIHSWKDQNSPLPASLWGDTRVLFIQHPSDPVVWWNPALIFDPPDWLLEPPGFDRLPAMQWFFGVTFWQVSLDLPVAANVPNGHGHNYGNSVLDGMLAIEDDQRYNRKDAKQLESLLDEAMAGQGPEKEVGVDNG